MPKRIYVGNLPVRAEPEHLESFCSTFGEVIEVKIKGSKGAIEMASGAEAASKALDGHVVDGNTLSIVVNHEEQDWL